MEEESPEEQLAQFNQDTRDSIRGKNNYNPGLNRAAYNEPSEPYWPDYTEIAQNEW
jgi:hypothetical protein